MMPRIRLRRVTLGLIAALLFHASAGSADAAAAGSTHATTKTPPKLDRDHLATSIQRIATGARPAVLGVGVEVLATGERWFLNADQPLPMQSVFKAPLGAAVLDAVDRGSLSLDSVLVIQAGDLSVPFSAINDSFPARTRWTIGELLNLAVGSSDNTAADLLLHMIGGPSALTAWLRGRGIEGIRVDRYEHELQMDILGLGPFEPAWASPDSLERAKLSVPEDARQRAMDAYLHDERDTMTPRGAIDFLRALSDDRLVSPASTQRLTQMMTDTTTGARRLRAGLPKGATLAHKTGTGPTVLGVSTACNDIGIVMLHGGRRIAIAALLSASADDEATRDAVLASVARAVVAALH